MSLNFDLRVKAKTPGRPDVLAAANVSATAAKALLERLVAVDLADPASAWMTPHESGVTVDNINERNTAHLEVLLAVLAHREVVV